MKLLDICPFVRYSFGFSFLPNRGCFTSRDCRLFYIVKGDGKLIIDDTVFNFTSASLFIWQAGMKYQFICDEPINIISINFDYTSEARDIDYPLHPVFVGYEKEKIENKKNIFFEDCPVLNAPVMIDHMSKIFENLNKILLERTTQQLYFTEFSSALMKECIVQIVRQISTPGTTSDNASDIADKFNAIIKYINQNYQYDISNQTLADLVGYHPYYLNRIWLAAQGITLHQYLINYRITISEQLLMSTNDPISVVASKVGFSNTVCFTNNFKKKNHVTPSTFRKKFHSV